MQHFEIHEQYEDSIISITNSKGNYIRIGDYYKVQKDYTTMLWVEISSIQLKNEQWVVNLNHRDLPLRNSTKLATNFMFDVKHYKVKNVPIYKSANIPCYEIY